MFSPERDRMRQVFLDAWSRLRAGEPLEPLEMLVAEVVREHPEYHGLLQGMEGALDRDYPPEAGQTNPFLHMGMHISLREQVGSGRPEGIREIYRALARHHGDGHRAEHLMMECLGVSLWEAQRSGRPPDEQAYLECLRALTGPG
jgi:hypothetical protein